MCVKHVCLTVLLENEKKMSDDFVKIPHKSPNCFFLLYLQRISMSPGDRGGRTPDSKKMKKDDSDGERSDQVNTLKKINFKSKLVKQ